MSTEAPAITLPEAPDHGDDPMGFRALRAKWQALPDLTPPLPPADDHRQLTMLADDFARFLTEPGAREFLAEGNDRRLASLIAWTTSRRSWTP